MFCMTQAGCALYIWRIGCQSARVLADPRVHHVVAPILSGQIAGLVL
jgi:hypothetical protein